jgi:hypothetical protein
MKPLVTILLVGLALMLGGCGSSNNSGTINGNWSAALLNSDGSAAFGFTATLTQASGSAVSVSNFNFTTSSPCFASATTQSASFQLTGNTNGNVTGNYGMSISTEFSAGQTNNQLTLQGTVSGGTISGTWSLTGQTGCTGSGTFTMTES